MLITAIMLMTLFITSGCSNLIKGTTSNQTPEMIKKDEWTEIGGDTFVFTSDFYMANMTLLTYEGEAVLIDTGMDEKDLQIIQRFIKDQNINLENIIITHMHNDHTANLRALQTEQMTLITPENAKQGQILELGKRTLKILFTEGHYKPRGHISVEVVEDNILVAGDILCNSILPPIAAGGNIEDLLTTLKELKEKNYLLIIPGHGEIVEPDVIFARQLEYLSNAKKYVEKLISSGGKMRDLNTIKLEDCIKEPSYLYEEQLEYWHIKNLETIYLNIKTLK
ncbi:MAG: endoribonuclease [Clostridiales bacterium]|nr:endoribonuclease [Clostridiales bacterium]